MTIKQFYLNQYATDELGEELNENATFIGLLDSLHKGDNVYDYIGLYDSLVRERLFEELASQLKTNYNYVYYLWLEG